MKTKKDWLTALASLFLLTLLPLFVCAQTNPFEMLSGLKKDTTPVVHDTVYIRIKPILTFNFPDYSPLKPADSDSLNASVDTLPAFSPFLSKPLFLTITKKKEQPSIRSFFNPHLLKVKDLWEKARRRSINDWAFLVLLSCYLLFAGVQFSYQKKLGQIFKAFGAGRFLSQLMRSGDFYKERISYNLFIITIITFPLFLFELNVFFSFYPLAHRPFTELLFYLEIFLLSLVFYFTKVITIRITGNIFKTSEITAEYLLTHFIFSLIQGLLLMGLLPVIIFTGSLVVLDICIAVFLVVYLYQLIRGFIIGLRNAAYNILYLFLFFFTIEVLPVLFLLKIISILSK
ncbi:MAG: DUF4271 domain-containing protein [Bacteroidetes bacterium]|nr:DUF4271 domain-containing protein [Bacteroidota bacterium]